MVAAVFLLGILTGTGATLLVVRHRVRAILDAPPDQAEARGLVEALNRPLRLSAAQREQIAAIHGRYLPELNRVRQKAEPELFAIRAREEADIRAVLVGEQQAKFDGMVSQFESRRKQILGLRPEQPWPAPSASGDGP